MSNDRSDEKISWRDYVFSNTGMADAKSTPPAPRLVQDSIDNLQGSAARIHRSALICFGSIFRIVVEPDKG